MESRNQYLKVIRERYFKTKRKKEKAQILDEYCRNTGQARKYVIRKMQFGVDLRPKPRRKRKQTYDGQVTTALSRVWEIFDCPCGQRLKPILEVEIDRLIDLGELRVCDEVALKLKTMSSATIDRKLKHQREVLHLLRSKGGPKPGSLLKRKIPIRLTEWDTTKTGYVEMDLVVHCGASTFGEYINTLSTTEVSSGWWEGEAIMGKSQESTFQSLKQIRQRAPFDWKGLDSDNGSEFNDLYRGDLRLYKNFLQPVMKLVSKERIGGSVKRKYDAPKTPYQRLMDSGQISEQTRKQLETVYLSLNPAQLKRSIDAKLEELYRTYEEKRKSQQVDPMKKVVPHTVTSFMIQRPKVGLPT